MSFTITAQICARCGGKVFSAAVQGDGWSGRPRFDLPPVPDGTWVGMVVGRTVRMTPLALIDGRVGDTFRGHWETCPNSKAPIQVIGSSAATVSTVVRP